jgi:hypothetical protein
MRRRTTTAMATLLLGTAACSALFGDTNQCSTDADCARYGAGSVCSAEQMCVAGSAKPSSAAPASDGGPSRSTDAPATGGAVASITIAPSSATVAPGLTQQFSAIGRDKDGNPPASGTVYTWSVSGGGTIGSTGLFTAGTTPGTFTVTATSGSATGTATVIVGAAAPIQMGETTILNGDDSNNANILIAQSATLAKAGTLKSLSLHVTDNHGLVRLGVYDATGPNGGPGAKKAETNEFEAQLGWNTVAVVAPVALAAGTYWLAYLPNDNQLHTRKADDGTGMIAYYNFTYGPLPATFSTTPTTEKNHFSFYATLTP